MLSVWVSLAAFLCVAVIRIESHLSTRAYRDALAERNIEIRRLTDLLAARNVQELTVIKAHGHPAAAATAEASRNPPVPRTPADL